MIGYGGWSWISKIYLYRFVFKLLGNINVNYRKLLEGIKNNMDENMDELDKRKCLWSLKKIKIEFDFEKDEVKGLDVVKGVD